MSDAELVVVVTGLSGAGKSTALHALEDLGFFCVDNLPMPVIAETLAACETAGVRRVALGIDVRVRRFLDRAVEVITSIDVPGKRDVDIMFLDAGDEALLRRFSSTRRPHPLSHTVGDESTQATAVLDGIRIERERLAPLRAQAKHVIDTTELSVHELRRRVLRYYGPGAPSHAGMHVRVVSFGFKYGTPVDADVVLDVRFLDNPYFVDSLKALDGTDSRVRDYVLDNPDARQFLDLTGQLLEFCLPRYEREGKSYLTLAVGCTGGRHRSVALAEAIAQNLRVKGRTAMEVVHRDLHRDILDTRGTDLSFISDGPKGGRGTS